MKDYRTWWRKAGQGYSFILSQWAFYNVDGEPRFAYSDVLTPSDFGKDCDYIAEQLWAIKEKLA